MPNVCPFGPKLMKTLVDRKKKKKKKDEIGKTGFYKETTKKRFISIILL